MQTADDQAPAASRTVALGADDQASTGSYDPRYEGYRRARPAVAARRLELGLKQQDLATELRISPATLCAIEKGAGGASPVAQLRILTRLGLEPDDAFFPEPRADSTVLTLTDAVELARRDYPHSKVKDWKPVRDAIERGELAAVKQGGAYGRYEISRDPYVQWLEQRTARRTAICSGCGRTFSRPPSSLARSKSGLHFCAECSCWRDRAWTERARMAVAECNRARWKAGAISKTFLARFGPEAARRWNNRWNGLRGGAPKLTARKRAQVETAAGVALECFRTDPGIAPAAVLMLVVRRLEGREPIFHPDGRRRLASDPVRRAAEKRARRLLEAAVQLPEYADTLLAREFASGFSANSAGFSAT